MPRTLPVALVIGALLISASPALAAKGGYRAEIRRTTGGVPHVKARDFGSLGYGFGYAYAQDQICEYASMIVTVSAQRSRYFGSEAESPNGGTNLQSDFFWQRIKDAKTVERLVKRRPPQGPARAVRQTIKGFATGYNAYLRKTGRAKLPDPTCRGKAWVRPITTLDVYRRFYQLGLRASSGNFLKEIVTAAPPAAGASAKAAALPSEEQLSAALADDPVLGSSHTMGSNAYGVGFEGTRDGRSVVLGNPHFPWQGAERWYELHLTVPGKLDAIGAALQGVPVVNVGFNRHVAWSHTVSTARRFTPYELKLEPGDPRSYLVDGKSVKMKRRTVSVRTSSGTQRHTFFETRWGPIFDFPLAGLVWDTKNAYALADVNADNFRLTNQWFEYDKAKSVGDLRRASARVQGNPWVNVIAADSAGRAYYADDSVVPNVDSALQKRCSTSAKAPLLQTQGVILLDGSRKSCRWGNDKDAVTKGILGPKALPRATRRDYVENSNDSYWLPSARFRLSGFPRIIGAEGTQRLLRTRLGLLQAEQRLAGTDGLGPAGFTIDMMKAVFNANRNLSGELARDAFVQACSASAAADLAEACAVLAAWDGRADTGSRGAVLWREAWTRLSNAGVPWLVPFDPADPANTPRGVNASDPKLVSALRGAVEDLRAKGIALDVPLGDKQAEPRGAERIGIPGCSEAEGCFNIISTRRDEQGNYDPFTGSSFVMSAGFDAKGRPSGSAILSYSQSENPESPFYADQTRLFSQEQWLPMRFTAADIKADPAYSRRVVTGRR
ncbi:MAG TPA: penicillin acylase family protein [Solirubrobacteraceae bacterium]|nr:penicillin acylase family protein [Solirubrobacteraceae bacterium]